MSNTFHRSLKHTLPTVVAGQGIYLTDSTGKRYIDASGGPATSCLGHGHPRVTQAMERQARAVAFAHSSFFTTPDIEALSTWLAERAPDGLRYAFFTSGGSEAMEAALKLARQFHIENGQPERSVFISRMGSYHGNTLGALAVSGHVGRRAPYLPLLMPTRQVSPCYSYRHQLSGESAEQYGQRLADELEATILEMGAKKVLAFIAETVVGAALGCVPAVPGYFQKIRGVCDKYGVLLILDEVMSGMGRTGRMFACEDEGITADILIMAKGLGAGYQPIGAMMVSERIHDCLEAGSGFFQHGHTYTAHPVACAVALEVQKTIEDEHLLDNVRERGAQLFARLHQALDGHPHVGDIRGRGLFAGIELVADRASKTPFPASRGVWARVKTEAMQRGMLVYPGGGTADGVSGDHIIIAPPFNCTEAEIDEIVARLVPSVDAAVR